MYNGYVPNKAGETSDHQNYPVPANNAAAQLVISKADALTVSQIYLEDQQRKIDEAQARLNMERAHLVEIARQQAMEAHLNAEIAAGEEAKRRLEALNIERQRSLASMNSSNVYRLPTYEPTPSTTRIVPVEDELRQYSGAPGNTWSNSSIVPNMSMRPNPNATSNHPHRTQQNNLQNLGPQSHYVAGAQARPQVPALTHQYQQRQAFPSQSSTSAHQPQFTQSYQPSQATQPAPLMRNQHQSQRPQQQQSAQHQSNFQPSRPSLQTSSTQSQQSIASQPALTPQMDLARQRQSITSAGQQSATQEPVPQTPTLNQVPPSKSHGKPVPSVPSASTSQTHSQSMKSAGRQTSGAIANLANPSRDTKHDPPSNPVAKVPSQSRPTQSAMANPSAAFSKQIEDLSPTNQRRLSSMHKYAYQWLKQAEVGATESIPLTGLFIHCPATGQAQIGEMVNNKFTPMTPIGWIKALQKMIIPEVSQTVAAPANAPPSVTPTTVAEAPPRSEPVNLPPTATPTVTKLKGHAESLVNALNSAHEHTSTPLPSLSKKNSNITGSPRTPADANRKSLARDLLFALGSVREKRQRESFGESDGRTAKRTALSDIPVPVAQSTVSSNQPPMVSSFPIQAAAFNYQHPSVISQPAVPQLPSDQSNVARQDKPSDVVSAVPSHQAGPSQANVNPDAAPVVTKPLKFVMENNPVAGPSRFVGRISQAITNFNTAITSSKLQTAPVANPPKLAPISISQNRLIPEQLPARSPPKVNVTPLFLPETPSPPTSPPPIPNMDEESLCLAESVTVRGSDIEPVDDFRARKGQTGTVVDYVQVPSAPGWVKRDLARRMRKYKKRQEEEEQAEIENVIEILDSDEEPEPRKTKQKYSRRSQSSREASDFFLPVRDPQELAALKKSITRIQECMCKWGGCEVILSSTEKLGQHMRQHVVESQQDKYGNPILCKICGKHEAQNPDHVENHAYHQLCCPYEGCDESFRSSRKLSQHSLKYHCDDQLRPSAEPHFPFQPASPPDIPSTLPSYMVVARAVTPHPISAQRHQILGPWVLKNMMPPVDSVSLKRYLKAKHLGRVEAPTTSDEYEFLVSRSSHSCMPSRPAKIRDFGDLNSDQVSQLINDGMSFWQEEKKDEETAFSEPGNSPPSSELPADADDSGVPSRRSTDELVLSGVGFDEELL